MRCPPSGDVTHGPVQQSVVAVSASSFTRFTSRRDNNKLHNPPIRLAIYCVRHKLFDTDPHASTFVVPQSLSLSACFPQRWSDEGSLSRFPALDLRVWTSQPEHRVTQAYSHGATSQVHLWHASLDERRVHTLALRRRTSWRQTSR